VKEQEKVLKALWNSNFGLGPLVSALASGEFQVVYEVGMWATAPAFAAKHGYHLLAFRLWGHAAAFAGNITKEGVPLEIWECVAEGVTSHLPRWGIGSIGVEMDCVSPPTPWPVGSVMAKKLKPIARIPFQTRPYVIGGW